MLPLKGAESDVPPCAVGDKARALFPGRVIYLRAGQQPPRAAPIARTGLAHGFHAEMLKCIYSPPGAFRELETSPPSDAIPAPQRVNRWYSLQISGISLAHTALLCGCIDANKDEIGLLDRLIDIRAKEQIASPASLDDLIETRFEYGQGIAVPSCDPGRVDVHDRDGDVGTAVGDDAAGGAADVARADAAYFADRDGRHGWCVRV